MFGLLARLFVVVCVLVVAIDALAHDSWISRGGHRNGAGEWCCGEGDCLVVAPERIVITAGGYAIVGQTAGAGGAVPVEVVPFSEAMPSQDGQYWRCKRNDGSRRCFFAPPPNT